MLERISLSINVPEVNSFSVTTSAYSLVPELAGWSRYVEQELRVAVIGFGKMGILHSAILNLLKPRLVRAVVEKSLLIRVGGSRLIKNVKFFRDIDKMVYNVNPDIVYVTTPAGTHYNIVFHLLDVGVDYVFVEKPPTINADQTSRLLNRISNKQIVMAGLQKRYALPFRHAKLLLSEGIIGDVKKIYGYIKSGDITLPTARFIDLGRGVLLDLGIHLVDLLDFFFGIESIEKARYRSIYSGVDDHFEAKLRACNGAIINIEVTWSDPAYRLPETFIEVHGTNGTLMVSEDYLKVETTEKHPLLGNNSKLMIYKPHYYQGLPPVNIADPEFTLENMHFLYCIYASVEPQTSLKNIERTIKLIDKLYTKAEM